MHAYLTFGIYMLVTSCFVKLPLYVHASVPAPKSCDTNKSGKESKSSQTVTVTSALSMSEIPLGRNQRQNTNEDEDVRTNTGFSLDDSQQSLVDAPVIVGVAGGSGSGKTTLVELIMKALGEDHVSYISHDNYYKDLSHLSFKERSQINFDHPNSLETDLLIKHLKELKQMKSINKPLYDFTRHARIQDTYETVKPRPIIIVDGILIFAELELLNLFDMKIFVDTDDDIRFIRRLIRDTTERNRTTMSVIAQYEETVRPMHLTYVEPSKRNADIIVPAGKGIRTVALDMCVSRLREIINFRH
jgi:uridine kinase